MFLFENFSNEVLELIFLHVYRPEELLKCTEISPRINDVISSSFNIVWKIVKDGMEVPPKHRKFTNVSIQDITEFRPQLEKFIATYLDTLTNIQMNNCTIKKSDLHSGLSMVAATLQKITFCNTTS